MEFNTIIVLSVTANFILQVYCIIELTLQQKCDTDILFVLDASTSVKDDFNDMKQYMEDVAKVLNIGPDKHRVAWLVYSGEHRITPNYTFDQITSNVDFLQKVKTIPYMQGTTFTGRALGRAKSLLKQRNKEQLTVVFVVSDGKAFDIDVVQKESAIIRSKGNVIVFAAAVPRSYDKQGLLDITGDESKIIFPPNVVNKTYALLSPFIACKPYQEKAIQNESIAVEKPKNNNLIQPITGCEIDLLFIVDFSSSVDKIHKGFIELAKKVVNLFKIGPGFTKVAMVKYSSKFNSLSVFHFNSFSNGPSVLSAMDNTLYMGGTTATGTGILKGMQEYTDPKLGARPTIAKKLTVLFSDGFSQEDPAEAAQLLRNFGVDLRVVGIERDIFKPNFEELEIIAGGTSKMYTNNYFDTLLDELSLTYRCNPRSPGKSQSVS